MDLEPRIEHETGLVRQPARTRGGRAVFVHAPTGQQFVLVPGGAFVMGMNARELVAALREVAYDPDLEFWRTAHRARYVAANPVHAVVIAPFLCGRSPLLGGTIDAAALGVSWTVHETAEIATPTTAGELRADDVARVLAHYRWDLISEAQWEYVARCGDADAWAGGTGWRKAVTELVHHPRCSDRFARANGWGVWGLALGEWVADQWHADYTGAPTDGSPWHETSGTSGPPAAVRGGAVLHAPWQDPGEAISCHVAARQGDGGWRRRFRARPVIALPWWSPELAPAPGVPVVPVIPDLVDFDTAVADLERELRAISARTLEAKLARVALYNSVHVGQVRSVGDPGVYIVKLAVMNGVLRAPELTPALRVGDAVRVRIVGTGGVPELALVSDDT